MTNPQMLRNSLALVSGDVFRFSFDRIPLRYPNVDSRRLPNLLLAGADQLLGRPRMLAAPPVIQIEPTNICNRSCPLYPSRTMRRPEGMMSLETFDSLLDGTAETLLLAILYGWGEQFLNAALPGMIARYRGKGVLTLTSTNGLCLQTPGQGLEVMDAGLSALIVAVVGTTQESYAAYRKNGSHDRVLRCIISLQEAKARRNSDTPFTKLRLVANRHNEEVIGKMKDMARELSVKMFSVKSPGCLLDKAEHTEFLPTSPDMHRFGEKRTKRPAKSTVRCRYPFRFWDGTVVGCEFDYKSGSTQGNVNTTPFRDIWNNRTARKLRESVLAWENRPEFCEHGPYVGRGRNSSIVESAILGRQGRNDIDPPRS